METVNKTTIKVETMVLVPVDKAWEIFTAPEHITKWYYASDDWHAPFAENDLQAGGKFKTIMAAKDGSHAFDFEGVYTSITPQKEIAYELADGRKVKITFTEEGDSTRVAEFFDAEDTHSADLQRSGWQSILDNFKKHAEAQ
jgi:uncharacterized protein YndB with AHSA1/START domain